MHRAAMFVGTGETCVGIGVTSGMMKESAGPIFVSFARTGEMATLERN
jgi:hypothetical protein